MAVQPPRNYTRLAIAIIVGALVTGGAVYLASLSDLTSTRTTTITASTGISVSTSSWGGTTSSIQVGTHFASALNNTLGLALHLEISVNASGALLVSANETNILNRANNVTTADSWRISPAETGTDPCGGFDGYPIQFAVLQGYLDASNYTSANPLTLYNTALPVECISYHPPSSILFAPLSDTASGSLVSERDTEVGYWTGLGSSTVFHPFPPGVYTVLTQDEWGDFVLLHFVVSG